MAGKSSVAILEKLEIRTIGELAQTDPEASGIPFEKSWENAVGICEWIPVMQRCNPRRPLQRVSVIPPHFKRCGKGRGCKKVLFSLAESVGKD